MSQQTTGGKSGILIAVAIAAVLLVYGSVFTVDERHSAVVFQLGEITDVITTPGLHFKIPLLQNVKQFDARIKTIDANAPERFITSEKKNMLVDLFVKWRVIDPKRYYKTVMGNEANAVLRLTQTVNSNMREEFGRRTVHEVISGQREQIMESMRARSDADARSIGVQIMDVRLKRVEFPDEVSESVYKRMEAERKRVANELRSLGAAEAERIRADADRQRDIIIAEAYREAQKMKGEGDSDASRIYGESFGKNADFAAFFRSMQAYKTTFNPERDVMVLDPSSEFFKYMRSSGGAGK